MDKTEEFDEYLKYLADLPAPQINSMIVSGYSDVEKETAGFRLLGQRYSLDSWIINNITFNKVKELENGKARLLPKVLDVAAGLGSDIALSIVNETDGESVWPTYTEQMSYIRSEVNKKGDALFSNSVSSGWLGALSKGLEEKDENWPLFMQSQAWAKKNLMTFLGGYTELKHDLILYTKQNGSGKGGDGPLELDDRGYVEPEPVIYRRLSSIVEATATGLSSYELISEEDLAVLNDLKKAYDTLENISRKELVSELPTDEEFDFIRYYDGILKRIWAINASEKAGFNVEGYSDIEKDYPSMLVTDIATDFDNGLALEIGNERPMIIYVAVYFDGQIRIARGVTFSSTEFTIPVNNRLTDLKWKEVIHSNNREIIPPLPSWYEDIYVKNNNFSGEEFKGTEGMSSIEDPNMLQIKAGAINVRQYPSKNSSSYSKVEKGQKIEFFFSVKNEGLTWYYVGSDKWIADDGTWVDILSYNGDIYNDGWYRSFDKSKIKRIQIIDEKMQVYTGSSIRWHNDEFVHSGETYLVMDVDDHINESTTWSPYSSPEYSVGYIWLQIGESKWIKVKNDSQIAVLEGEALDFSNAKELTSTDKVGEIMNRGYIEIIYGPLSFMAYGSEGYFTNTTYEGKEYASPGEIYNIQTIVPGQNNESWWAYLDGGIYLFIGNTDDLIVR